MVPRSVKHFQINHPGMPAALLSILLLTSGCLFQGATGSNAPATPGQGGGGGTGEPQIMSLQNDLQVAGSQSLTILYAVPEDATQIQAFRVPEGQSGDPAAFSFFSVALSSGEGQFTIDTGELPSGNYLIGVRYLDGSGATQTLFSTGVLRVQALPQPTFIEPSRALTVQSGAEVSIIADIGDIEGDVAWRVFFMTQDSAPEPTSLTGAQLAQLGNELGTGEGNAVNLTWTTVNVAEGVYVVGVSATDSGFSVVNTALAGDEDQIVTLYNTFAITIGEADDGGVNPLAPTVAVTQPANDRTIFGTEDISVVFSAQTLEGTQDLVRVFYDDDADFSNGVLGTISANLTTADSTASISSAALNEGPHRFGVSVDDGINDPVAGYAPGTITIVTTPTLQVTEPSETRIVRPNDTVIIRWSSNVPASAATTSVFATLVGDANAIPIDIPTTDETSATWTTSVGAGIYAITVRMVFNDTTVADVSAAAPGLIRVSNAPPIIWVGCFGDAASRPVECPDPTDSAGVIFESVQFEDNLGSAFAPVGDMDADGVDDFMMVARYGKPFFSNPDGIGHGEAYLINGGPRLSGSINVNSVGGTLKGVTFTGIRTPQGNTETDGLSDVVSVPDVDGDNRPELVFGFPDAESRGHNVDERQNGVVDPRTLITLERENQFMRGGIVMVSSKNSILRNPSDPSQSPVMKLDMVGQDFDETRVHPPLDALDDDTASTLAGVAVTLDPFRTNFVSDVWSFNETDLVCEGGCLDNMTDSEVDANETLDHGFARALARDYFATYVYDAAIVDEFAIQFINSATVCALTYCVPLPPTCEPFSPGLHDAADNFTLEVESLIAGGTYQVFGRRSGFYPAFTDVRGPIDLNRAKEPLGARIIGVGMEDKFGSTLGMSAESTGSAGSLIVAAPERDAIGILAGPLPGGCLNPTACGGEIDGLESSPGSPKTNPSSGVAYLFPVRNLWESQIDVNEQNVRKYPPTPHQYIVGEASHSCGGPLPQIDNVDAVRIAGNSNEEIRNIQGIPDFNGDGRDDFVVGSPKTDRVYIAFRRDPAIEGDYVLEKLELSINDAERLSGALITGATGSQFAASIATDVDLNGDGVADLVVGAPLANGGVGEVVVIYASPDLITGQSGVNIETLIAQGRAARITGRSDNSELSMFGFNLASAGDIDGDGTNDLLISAPAGTPRYDSTPDDSDDTLDAFGLDLNGNGVQDDVTGITAGNFGRPDGLLTDEDDLAKAGLVYIVWGSNVLVDADNEFLIADLGSAALDGAIIVGRRPGDYFGGGDAGDVLNGGISAKMDRGRSAGLKTAGDADGDGLADVLIGSVLANPRVDPESGKGTTHGGEAYLMYGFRR
ncbi:MAG: integrin alpha [Phycisphaerae bacterium]